MVKETGARKIPKGWVVHDGVVQGPQSDPGIMVPSLSSTSPRKNPDRAAKTQSNRLATTALALDQTPKPPPNAPKDPVTSFEVLNQQPKSEATERKKEMKSGEDTRNNATTSIQESCSILLQTIAELKVQLTIKDGLISQLREQLSKQEKDATLNRQQWERERVQMLTGANDVIKTTFDKVIT